MSERVKIADIADELGLSTATVSNVIHGKAGKASAETARRVQALLEERQYIPSMAALLLAQNDSKIIGLVINDHAKYEGHTLEDNFISASLNALLPEIERAGKFLMLKLAKTLDDVPKFASMWNMEGMVLIGFCEQDYRALREKMRIPFLPVLEGQVAVLSRRSHLRLIWSIKKKKCTADSVGVSVHLILADTPPILAFSYYCICGASVVL